mgnify:CR=1 FL=1
MRLAAAAAVGTVTAVTGTAPVASTGGTTPAISVPVATATVSGLVPTPPNNTTTFLRGDATFAAASTIVRKTADETVNNSSTLQNDDELLFAIAANEIWLVQGFLSFNSSTVADIRSAITVPAGATLIVNSMALAVGTAASNGELLNTSSTTSGGAVLAGGTGADSVQRLWAIVVNGANAGNCQVQWAQSTAEASNTIVRANSFLQAFKV